MKQSAARTCNLDGVKMRYKGASIVNCVRLLIIWTGLLVIKPVYPVLLLSVGKHYLSLIYVIMTEIETID